MTVSRRLESAQNSETYDKRILEMARRLCEQLNCPRLSPRRLSWQERSSRSLSRDKYGNPIGPPATTHYPLFWRGALIINPVLKDRLSIDELRPLITSSVLYYGQLIWRLKRRMALMSLLVFLVLAGFSLFVFTGGSSSDILFFFLIFFTALFVPIGLAAYFSRLWSRKFMLQADNRVAEQIGARPLLEALRKIQALRDSDKKGELTAAWAWVEYGSDAPSVEKRIRNLMMSESPRS